MKLYEDKNVLELRFGCKVLYNIEGIIQLCRGGMQMLNISNFLTRNLLNILFSSTIFILTVINFDLGVVIVPLITIFTYVISNFTIKYLQKRKKSKELGLTFSEYKMIENQIDIAKKNINSLAHQFLRVRSIRSFKLLNEITKVSRRIVNIVQANPQKFYQVENFFYSHLPSAVELTQKYTLLTQQQLKDQEVHLTLQETRKTLKDLHDTMEEDLYQALQSDIENLKIELDFVKMENEKNRQQLR